MTYTRRKRPTVGMVKIRRMPAMKVATISKGPETGFKSTYTKLGDWIEKKG